MNMKKYFKLIGILICATIFYTQVIESSGINEQLKSSDKLAMHANLNLNSYLFNYEVGDFEHGGIVFYIDDSGQHGLVCTKEDYGTGVKWGNRKKVRRNERFSEDMSTTTTIFNEKSVRRDSIGEDHAMQICEKLKVIEGGKTYKDWYLPSKEELNMMYLDAVKIDSTALANGGSPFAKTYYWSATEVDYTSAWVQYFENGNQAQHFKNYRYNARAVRAF
jgi:hypothetical protein